MLELNYKSVGELANYYTGRNEELSKQIFFSKSDIEALIEITARRFYVESIFFIEKFYEDDGLKTINKDVEFIFLELAIYRLSLAAHPREYPDDKARAELQSNYDIRMHYLSEALGNVNTFDAEFNNTARGRHVAFRTAQHMVLCRTLDFNKEEK